MVVKPCRARVRDCFGFRAFPRFSLDLRITDKIMRIARSEVLKGKANEEEICSFAVLLPLSMVAVVASYSSKMSVAGGESNMIVN